MVSDIVRIVVKKNKEVDRITSIKVRRPSDTSKGMTIYLEIILFFGAPIYEVVKSLQTRIKLKVEGMTSMPVKNIDVSIRSLTVRPPDLPKHLQEAAAGGEGDAKEETGA